MPIPFHDPSKISIDSLVKNINKSLCLKEKNEFLEHIFLSICTFSLEDLKGALFCNSPSKIISNCKQIIYQTLLLVNTVATEYQ